MLWGGNEGGCWGCVLGPNTRLADCAVGANCVLEETVAVQSVLEDGVSCGPRAYLRPGTYMEAGTCVEIKKSHIGAGSKVPHLSYIGDCDMGPGVNVGAGSITCNYDGANKHRTVIGANAFIGSDTMMVAPVQIGDDVAVGAGSVITQDVPNGALALGRARQVNKEGWKQRQKACADSGSRQSKDSNDCDDTSLNTTRRDHVHKVSWKYAKELRQDLGWVVATSQYFGAQESGDVREYTFKVKRSSLQG